MGAGLGIVVVVVAKFVISKVLEATSVNAILACSRPPVQGDSVIHR